MSTSILNLRCRKRRNLIQMNSLQTWETQPLEETESAFPHTVFITVVFSILKSRSVSLQTIFFFKTVLATVCFLNFHMNFWIILQIQGKNPAEIFLEILLNLWINFVNTDIIIIFSLLIHECGISFHLLMSSLFSFSNVFCFQSVHFYLFC